MKVISSLNDLSEFGIHPLTGEADAIGFRLLCDLTYAGRSIVAETYGLLPASFPESWNCGSKLDPHVASAMLPYTAWKDIGIVALLMADHRHTVIKTENCLFGLGDGERYLAAEWKWSHIDKYGLPERGAELIQVKPAKLTADHGEDLPWLDDLYGEVQRVFRPLTGHPVQGTRCVHAMTGRSL